MQQETRHERPRVTTLLPRLRGGAARPTALWNLLGLLVAGLAGAALVHLLAYHLPASVPLGGRWGSAFLTLLARCPLRVPLTLAAVVAALALILVLRDLWRLERLNRALAVISPRQRRREGLDVGRVPRSPWRLAGFIIVLLGLQAALFGMVSLLCPMRTSMVMNGAPMAMPISPALPLAPLHLLVASVIGLLLWLTERHLTHLREQIAGRLRLLAHVAGVVPWVNASPARAPHQRCGHALFARPPPAFAL